MKIMPWNVRGLDGRRKRRVVKEIIKKKNPDVTLLQETKSWMEIEDLWVALGVVDLENGYWWNQEEGQRGC